MKLSNYKIPSTKNIKLKDYNNSEGKKEITIILQQNIVPALVEKLKELQFKITRRR